LREVSENSEQVCRVTQKMIAVKKKKRAQPLQYNYEGKIRNDGITLKFYLADIPSKRLL